MKRVLLILSTLLALGTHGWCQEEPSKGSLEEALKLLPIQSGGRMKPFDTFARESVQAITGKSRWKDDEPVVTALLWWANPASAQSAELIEFRDPVLKLELGLNPEQRWFPLEMLMQNPKLLQRQEVIHRRLRGDEELPLSDQKVSEVLDRIALLNSILNGSALKVVPHPKSCHEPWKALSELEDSEALTVTAKLRGCLQNESPEATQTVLDWRSKLSELGPLPDSEAIAREVHYNRSHPFRAAWLLYLMGFLALIAGSFTDRLYRLGVLLAGAGFLVHLYGFILRCSIAGRPPVTNMYESVVWVAFGAMGFAFILERLSARGLTLPAACFCATLCLIMADMLPTVLDPSIQPLTPVLRSNFWLTIHVLSITLGYAAFLLALGIGHWALWKAAQGNKGAALLHDAVYKAVQIGVVFLAAGTILGGVWANESWGRFWGWDPKEVWALIALLGYLAILHGRYAGWLRKFGVTAWSVLAFQGVVMAWYGVNYVLGTGLHSYGFGTGGGSYVGCFVLLEFLYVSWAVSRYHQWARRLKETQAGGCPFTRLASLFKEP